MDGLRIVGKGARLAGLGTRNLHYYMQDRVYHSRTMLKWRGTPEAVLLRENPDYNNLTLAQQAGVERYLLTRKTVDEAPYPVGSAPYNVLNTAHTAYSVL